jgi:hypothetical protein
MISTEHKKPVQNDLAHHFEPVAFFPDSFFFQFIIIGRTGFPCLFG